MKSKLPLILGATTFILGLLLYCTSFYLVINLNAPPRSEKDVIYGAYHEAVAMPLHLNSTYRLYGLFSSHFIGEFETYTIISTDLVIWFLLGHTIGKWFEINQLKLDIKKQRTVIIVTLLLITNILINAL
jgi:hypothetical protein